MCGAGRSGGSYAWMPPTPSASARYVEREYRQSVKHLRGRSPVQASRQKGARQDAHLM